MRADDHHYQRSVIGTAAEAHNVGPAIALITIRGAFSIITSRGFFNS